ncbi:MAG: radical SAM protein [Clostridiales bacterium]
MKNKEMLEIEFLAKKYNENKIPLYVSYPTTSWWKDDLDYNTYKDSFKNSNINFIYVHFPYCKKPCYYCCCYKEVAKDETCNDKYLDYLDKEFKLKTDLIGKKNFSKINKIHWGGGTPTFMNLNQINKAFNIMKKYIDILDNQNNITMSIEAYPDKEVLTFEKLKLLKSLGFNEISLGIQDFDKNIQNTINRDCNEEDVREIVLNSKKLGLKVHIDLCYGLPFQGINEFSRTVNTIVSLDIERVAVFSYIHFPMFFPMQKLIPKSSLGNSFMMVLLMKTAERIFEENNFYKIGYDHFVKEEDPLFEKALEGSITRDFMGQSLVKDKNFVGFGNSAISYANNNMFHNIQSIDKYYEVLEKGIIPLKNSKNHQLSKDDRIRNRLILRSILSDFKINKTKYEFDFGINFDEYFEVELKELLEYEKDGLVENISSDKIIISNKGKYFARHIAHVFDKYYR